MTFFKDKSLYEEIEPGTQTYYLKSSKMCKFGGGFVLLTVVATIVLVLGLSTTSSDDSLVPTLRLDGEPEDQDKIETVMEDIVVQLDKGTIRGFKMISRGGREFLAFRGIPYAKPPVGQLRFQPPEEVNPWDDVLNATDFKPDCSQRSKGSIKGDEDCLYLNVYTPKKFQDLGRRAYLPVMVYIHGGVAGGSSKRNSGEYLMDQDVVLVGMNYRVGILGNLNTNDSLARGNQGLRDQIKALEWVKDNIRKFGGDRKKVTLFGNSFGAMGISTHLLSPMTKGLFHRAICQSGSAVFPELIQRDPLADALNLGKRLECNATNTTELLTCFRNMDLRKLIISSYEVKVDNGHGLSISANAFLTTVDPLIDNVDKNDVYLPEPPLQLLQGGKLKRMPVIIGINQGEGLFQSVELIQSKSLMKRLNDQWDSIAPEALILQYSPNAKEIVNSTRNFYFGTRDIDQSTRDNVTDLFSDRQYIHPAHVHATFQKEVNRRRENVYLYYFTKEVEMSYADLFGSKNGSNIRQGPAHADEIQFLFPYEPFPLIPAGSKNANFSTMMVRLWTNFARDGKPGLADNQVEWLPVKSIPFQWFQLNEAPKMTEVLAERMEFWDSFELSDLYY